MNSRQTATLMNGFTGARSAIPGLPVSCAMRRKRKSTAMPARFDSTRTVAAIRPQPAIQPIQGPKARAAQVNDVPESGIRVVELAVAEGDQQHRDEADEDDRGHLDADGADTSGRGPR